MGTKLIITEEHDRPPITVLRLEGRIDGFTYETLLERAKAAYDIGTQDLVLDLTRVLYISSAGLVALHQITRMMCHDPIGDLDGWAALHAMANETDYCRTHVKLVNPQPNVTRTLELAGMQDLFEIYSDLESALASFENAFVFD